MRVVVFSFPLITIFCLYFCHVICFFVSFFFSLTLALYFCNVSFLSEGADNRVLITGKRLDPRREKAKAVRYSIVRRVTFWSYLKVLLG
jgi:hypothetical protein